MHEKDRTFSDRDVVRIFVRELTRLEQENVRAWFLIMEINKRNEARGATLILKIATLFLRSIPGFGALVNIFLEGKDVFEDMLSEREAIERVQKAGIPLP